MIDLLKTSNKFVFHDLTNSVFRLKIIPKATCSVQRRTIFLRACALCNVLGACFPAVLDFINLTIRKPTCMASNSIGYLACIQTHWRFLRAADSCSNYISAFSPNFCTAPYCLAQHFDYLMPSTNVDIL